MIEVKLGGNIYVTVPNTYTKKKLNNQTLRW